ncbi:MAG: hypothetical protein U0572_17560 [Phycisphaerales bacterium]
MDGTVGSTDLGMLLGSWGPCSIEILAACTCADLDHDGEIDSTDLGILLGAWGVCSYSSMRAAESEAVTEDWTPSSLAPFDGFDSSMDFAAWLGTLSETQRLAVLSPLLD